MCRRACAAALRRCVSALGGRAAVCARLAAMRVRQWRCAEGSGPPARRCPSRGLSRGLLWRRGVAGPAGNHARCTSETPFCVESRRASCPSAGGRPPRVVDGLLGEHDGRHQPRGADDEGPAPLARGPHLRCCAGALARVRFEIAMCCCGPRETSIAGVGQAGVPVSGVSGRAPMAERGVVRGGSDDLASIMHVVGRMKASHGRDHRRRDARRQAAEGGRSVARGCA